MFSTVFWTAYVVGTDLNGIHALEQAPSRTAIHAYGAALFKNDPGLIDRINRFEDRHVKGDLIEMYKYVNRLDEINWEMNQVVNTPKVEVLT